MKGDKNNTNLESLFILQKKVLERALKLSLVGTHNTHFSCFYRLKKLKIRDLYIYQLTINMFRHHSNLLPLDLPSISFINQSDIHNYNTRHVSDLHIAPSNTNWQKIPSQFWNKVNAALKNCKSLATFKTCLKYIFLINIALKSTNIMYVSIV